MAAPTMVHVVVHEGVARITLDRPPLNHLGVALLDELGSVLLGLPQPPEVRFVVFSGGGSRAFSAGLEVAELAPDRVETTLTTFHGIFRRLWKSRWLTIAAVKGHCLGAGMELAAFCDFVIAADQARFAQPEINLACFPPVAAILLPQLIGLRRTRELLFTGKSLTAREARDWGLINEVVPADELNDAVTRLVENLSPLSSAALHLTRKAIIQASGIHFDDVLTEMEFLYINELMKTHDAPEGIAARLERRQPDFTGR